MTEALASIFRKPSHENAYKVYSVSIFASLCLLLLAFAIYRSAYSPEPIALTDVVVRVAPEGLEGGVQLTETRRFVGYAEETIGVMRGLYAKADPTRQIALEGGLFAASTGPFTTVNIITVPSTVSGTWCLKTSYNWWPSWSQREFVMDTPDICFETTPDA